MASFTDEIRAIADVYAESLLLIAKQKGQHEELAAEFAELIAYMDQHPDFDRFLTSATVDDDSRRESLDKLFRGKMSDLLLNLLQVLNNRSRLDLVRAVERAVELRLEEEHHQREVLVETATPLTDDLRARVKDVLSRCVGREALLIEKVRPELIGGLIVHIGDMRLDGSLATSIRSFRERLANRARQEIHRGDEKYLVEN